MIKDEAVGEAVPGCPVGEAVPGCSVDEAVPGRPVFGAVSGCPKKKRDRKGEWKRQKRVDTRRGKKDYHKPEGEVPCE